MPRFASPWAMQRSRRNKGCVSMTASFVRFHAVKCMRHGIIVDERMKGVFMSKIIVVNAGPRKGCNRAP